MAELADAADSKSAEGNLVGVRPPLPAPNLSTTIKYSYSHIHNCQQSLALLRLCLRFAFATSYIFRENRGLGVIAGVLQQIVHQDGDRIVPLVEAHAIRFSMAIEPLTLL